MLNGQIMKVHFTLMAKRLLEYLHVNILHCLMTEDFPLVGKMMIVIHSKVQSVAWKFMLLVRRIVMVVIFLINYISTNDKW